MRGIKTEKPELGKLRHLPEKERKTLFISELINQNDWDEANWKNGVGYLWSENSERPPVLILFFETLEQGQKLFSSLIDKTGIEDKSERLRVSIVEGKVPKQKDGYFIVIGENIEAIEENIKSEGRELVEYIAVNQRLHRVDTDGESPSLKKFKEEYDKFKCFYVAPGIQNRDGRDRKPFEIDYELMIFKRKIEFRNYNDIPKYNDPDSILKTVGVQEYKF